MSHQIDIDESCPECGDSMFVNTTRSYALDGDLAECPSCGFAAGLSIDEEGESWVQSA